jgi:hypothetical protein
MMTLNFHYLNKNQQLLMIHITSLTKMTRSQIQVTPQIIREIFLQRQQPISNKQQ